MQAIKSYLYQLKISHNHQNQVKIYWEAIEIDNYYEILSIPIENQSKSIIAIPSFFKTMEHRRQSSQSGET